MRTHLFAAPPPGRYAEHSRFTAYLRCPHGAKQRRDKKRNVNRATMGGSLGGRTHHSAATTSRVRATADRASEPAAPPAGACAGPDHHVVGLACPIRKSREHNQGSVNTNWFPSVNQPSPVAFLTQARARTNISVQGPTYFRDCGARLLGPSRPPQPHCRPSGAAFL